MSPAIECRVTGLRRVGALDRHGNPNVLTIDKGASKLSQATIAQSCLVQIERYNGELPAINIAKPRR